ncbi:MAG: hypothetical protein QOD72_1919 [Acidimicrobiaceae bacterium]|nr:hypothetical protein [Acidimicrobiaceae bacterium]
MLTHIAGGRRVIALQLAADGLVFTGLLILLGQSIVVVHRGSGVINFGSAAVGMVAAYLFYNMWPGHGLPWPVALVIALAAAGVIGSLMYLVVLRQLRKSSVATKVIATLGLMLLATALTTQYFSPRGDVRAVKSFLPERRYAPFADLHIGSKGPIIVVIALVVTALLWAIQKYTRFGLATSAVCENETVASGMGLSPHVISAANWALGSAIGAVAIILVAPISGLSPQRLPLLIVPALGAALIGRFDSLLLTLVGALAIGIGEAEVGVFTTSPGWNEAAPLIVIVAVLIIRRPPRFDRSDAAARLPRVGSGRIGGWAVFAGVVSLVAVLTVSLEWLNPLAYSIIIAIGMLSVVVITGYAGQLSLAQFGLAGLGAFFTALFAAGHGLPLSVSMILGVIVTVPLGLLVGVPALRTKGPTLAIATLSLVVVIGDLLLNNPTTVRWFKSGALPPLSIFGYSLNNITQPRRFAVFAWIVLVLVALATANLRRSAMGRRLLAIRTNPQAAQALGISPVAMQVYAFTVATVMAATCGAMVEALSPYTSFTVFGTVSSIIVVLQTTVGGIGLIPGALFGGAGFASGLATKVISLILSPSNWLDVITGASVLVVVLQAPNGIAAQMGDQVAWVQARLRRLRRRPAIARDDAFGSALKNDRVRQGRRQSARLDAYGVTVTFGGVRALSDASLSVAPGQIVGLIGPNGAGKSTFIEAVCGSVKAAGGRVTLDGVDIQDISATQRARRGLARSFQSLELFEDMTVGENLLAACEKPSWWHGLRDLFWPRKVTVSEAATRAARDFGLEPFLGATPRSLDHGRRRLVAIARAFASDPAVLFLDEPAAGLDPQERNQLGLTLRKVASEWNVGILLVEHDVDMVFRVCDVVTALVAGVAVASGTPAEVRVDPAVTEAYLGRADIAEPAPSANGSNRVETSVGGEGGQG